MNLVNEEQWVKIKKIPLTLILSITLICCGGFVILYSVAGGSLEPWASKQIMKFCLFLPVAILIALIELRIIFKLSYIFYIAVLLSLVYVELFGSRAMGAERWLDLGFIKLQPSEPAKLAIVLMVARYIHQLNATSSITLPKVLILVGLVIAPTALIIKQPDLGTAVVIVIVVSIMIFSAGLPVKYFLGTGACGLLCLPIIWHLMYEYQRQRVLTFFNPESDPLGAGYNIIQSKIAIGSGGLLGKGLISGTQSQLDFLPEYQTDFIFAALAEEVGFIGCFILLMLYLIISLLCLVIAVNCRSVFGKLMVVGISCIFFSHIFINIAMVMGMLPAVGIPLPLLSYGGTMMASMLIGFGLIMNAQVHQYSNL